MLHTALTTIQLAGGVAPPGSDKLQLIGSWSTWVAGVALAIAVIIAGVMIAFSGSGRGGGGEHGSKLLWALVGAIVVGAASGLVSELTG